jgi:hypothetical protein
LSGCNSVARKVRLSRRRNEAFRSGLAVLGLCSCHCPGARRELAVRVRPPVPGGRREDQADAGSTRGTELRALPGSPERGRDRERAPSAVAADHTVLQPALVRVSVHRRARRLRVASRLVTGRPGNAGAPSRVAGGARTAPSPPRRVAMATGRRPAPNHRGSIYGRMVDLFASPCGSGLRPLHRAAPAISGSMAVWQMLFLSCMRAKVLFEDDSLAFMGSQGSHANSADCQSVIHPINCPLVTIVRRAG